MKHDHSISHTRRVDHSISARIVLYPDFLNPLAYRWHRFEIIRLTTPLQLIQLIARVLPRLIWKIPQTFERVTQESNGLHATNILIWIYLSNRCASRRTHQLSMHSASAARQSCKRKPNTCSSLRLFKRELSGRCAGVG